DVLLVQDTVCSTLAGAGLGTRGKVMCHAEPSQVSASGRLTPSEGMYQPTPMQNRSAGQDTPRNWSAGATACCAAAAVTGLTGAAAAGVIAPAATVPAATMPAATTTAGRTSTAARTYLRSRPVELMALLPSVCVACSNGQTAAPGVSNAMAAPAIP